MVSPAPAPGGGGSVCPQCSAAISGPPPEAGQLKPARTPLSSIATNLDKQAVQLKPDDGSQAGLLRGFKLARWGMNLMLTAVVVIILAAGSAMTGNVGYVIGGGLAAALLLLVGDALLTAGVVTCATSGTQVARGALLGAAVLFVLPMIPYGLQAASLANLAGYDASQLADKLQLPGFIVEGIALVLLFLFMKALATGHARPDLSQRAGGMVLSVVIVVVLIGATIVVPILGLPAIIGGVLIFDRTRRLLLDYVKMLQT